MAVKKVIEMNEWKKVLLWYKKNDRVEWTGKESCYHLMSTGKFYQNIIHCFVVSRETIHFQLFSPVADVLKKSKILFKYQDVEQVEATYYTQDSDTLETNMTMIREHMMDKNSSVVITCADTSQIRTLMLAANRIGMLDSGQFVFFNFDLFQVDDNQYTPWFDQHVGYTNCY